MSIRRFLTARGMTSTLALVVVTAIAIVGIGSPAQADPPAASAVRSLVVESFGSLEHSTLSLTFDKAISPAEANAIRQSLATPQVGAGPAVAGSPMWCGSHISTGDSDGNFDIQYYCGSNRTLPWGFQLSAALRAIIVSNVTESGMIWWLNGNFAGQNRNHVVPSDYTFHGTLNPVFAGNQVDYMDYFTFRHNVGGGGSGSVTLTGTVTLMN